MVILTREQQEMLKPFVEQIKDKPVKIEKITVNTISNSDVDVIVGRLKPLILGYCDRG